MVRHPRGSYIVIPIAVSGVATPENKVTHWHCHIHEQESKGAEVRLTSNSRNRQFVGTVSGSWKDAVHPSCDSPNTSRRLALGASNVCWLVKTRLVPSRHGRGARVYGHTTTAMHNKN